MKRIFILLGILGASAANSHAVSGGAFLTKYPQPLYQPEMDADASEDNPDMLSLDTQSFQTPTAIHLSDDFPALPNTEGFNVDDYDTPTAIHRPHAGPTPRILEDPTNEFETIIDEPSAEREESGIAHSIDYYEKTTDLESRVAELETKFGDLKDEVSNLKSSQLSVNDDPELGELLAKLKELS